MTARRPRWPRAALWTLTWAVAAAACTAKPHPALPPPAAPRDGALYVQLSWSAAADLDLYVTDPAGESLYFGNNPTRAGARLSGDARCAALADHSAGGLERAVMADPAPGRYRIGVDYLEECGDAAVVPFAVAVEQNAVRGEAAGEARPRQFNVVVLEFEVGEDGRLMAPAPRGER